MALAFRDFSPRSSPSKRGPGGMTWEPMPAVLARVDQWLAESGVQLVNIETLLVPVVHGNPTDSFSGALAERWDEDHAFAQIVRVWHHILAPVAAAAPALAAPATAAQSVVPLNPPSPVNAV